MTLSIGIITIAILIYQQCKAEKVARANFWLKLEETLSTNRRECVHLKIMNKAFDEEKFEEKNSYWVDDYLGIFELCNVMIDQKVIDIETFKAIYRYRLIYFLRYEFLVKEKLIKEGFYYEYLYRLFDKWSSENKKWRKFWEEKIKNRPQAEQDDDDDELNNQLYKKLKTELITPFLQNEKILKKKIVNGKMLLIDLKLALAYCNIGIAYDDLGNYREAIKCYQKAVTIDPNYASAYNNMGKAYDA
jgi:tetratricopeptide (TPR) repeat protein